MSDEIQAGRDTDRRVAEVLGYTPEDEFDHIWIQAGNQWGGIELPHYSTRAGDALSLVKRMQREGKALIITAQTRGGYAVMNYEDRECTPLAGWDWEDEHIDVSADSFSLAVCRFVLAYLETRDAN